MAKVNKHGLQLKGLRKASGATIDWHPRSGGYTEIFYNKESGEVWTVDQISLGHNSWTEYHDKDIIKITETEVHLTMQQIADIIADEIAQRALWR